MSSVVVCRSNSDVKRRPGEVRDTRPAWAYQVEHWDVVLIVGGRAASRSSETCRGQVYE